MSDFKNLDQLKNTSVDVEQPEMEEIIPRVGGPEEDYEEVDEQSTSDVDEAPESIVDTLNRDSKEATGVNLDFSEMFERHTSAVREATIRRHEEQEAIREEKEADSLIDDEFGDQELSYEEQEVTKNDTSSSLLEEEEETMIDIGSVEQNAFDVPDDFIEKVLYQEEQEERELEEEDTLTEEERKEIKQKFNEDSKRVNNRLKELLAPVEEKMGEKGFSVSKRVININNFLEARKAKKAHEADWVLMTKGKKITVSALSADEIILLDINASSKSKLSAIRDAYMVIYNHITSPKPETFEEWIKTEYSSDLNDYYMALYRATFENANHFPNVCNNDTCNHVFLSENIDIFDMVEFKNDKAKERFYDILDNGDYLEKNPLLETRIIPISEDIAVELKIPTIYSSIYEFQALPDDFKDSKQEMLAIISYIESFYYIEDGEYRPFYMKNYPSNIAKTIKYKIALFSQIIKNLKSDEYGKLISYVTNIGDIEKSLSYHYPDTKCPKCGTVVEHDDNEHGLALLFKRHQLVTILNTWEK